MNDFPAPQSLTRDAHRASAAGNDLLRIGLSVGAIGLAGAALGAVCPVCVVATPALVGLGAVQKLRGLLLARRAERVWRRNGLSLSPQGAPHASH